MAYNGPAIKAVCVTRRQRRAGSGTLARIESRRKEGMARFLASWYKVSGLYECRGTNELSDWY